MSESYGDPQKSKNNNGSRIGFRGGKGPGNRDGGGFRIRLSDNEMRASRALQEAFNLRSTVAAMGFALRTLGQMLEEGKLDSLIDEYRSQAPHANNYKKNQESANKRFNQNHIKNSKPDPFARPIKPEASQTEEKIETEEDNEIIKGEESKDTDESQNATNQEDEKKSTEETNQ